MNGTITATSDRVDAMVEALRRSLGSERIVVDPEALAFYADDLSATPRKNIPVIAVRARTVEDVQAAVAVANRFRVPITSFSAGYGLGTALAPEGAIILDMREMGRVLEINEAEQFVLVEPGVTFEQVGPLLSERGLITSVPDAPPGASVVANHLNFGIGSLLMERGAGPELVLSLEAVLPTGEVIRTGSAMGWPNNWFARFAFPPVPDLTGLFLGARGTTGVITKLAVRVFPMPETILYQKYGFDSLDIGVRAMREVSRKGLVDRVVGYNWVAAPEVAPGLDSRVDGRPWSRADLAALRETAANVPESYFFVGYHGLAAVVEARSAAAERIIAASHGGRRMEMTELERERSTSVARGLAHDLSLRAVQRQKGRYRDSFHIFYAMTPIDRLAELYARWSDIGLKFGHPLVMNTKWYGLGRAASLHSMMSYFDRKQEGDRRRIDALCLELEEAAAKVGAIGGANTRADTIETLTGMPLYRRLKEAIDPNGIMRQAVER